MVEEFALPSRVKRVGVNTQTPWMLVRSTLSLSRQSKEKGHQVRAMGVLKCGGAHFQRDCNASKNTGKQFEGQSKGSKGAKGSGKGISSKTDVSGHENFKSETSAETQESVQMGQACTTDTSWTRDEWSLDEWNDGWSLDERMMTGVALDGIKIVNTHMTHL